MVRSMLRIVVLLSFFLSACFSSEKPLLTEDDAVTPFPDTFTIVKLDEKGKIKTDEKGAADIKEFTRSGKLYLHQVAGGRHALTAAALDDNPHVFLVQDVMSTQDPQKGEVYIGITYYLAAISDNTVFEFIPPAPGKTDLDAALKNAGVVYTTVGEKFVFSDKTQLLAAARVYLSHVAVGQMTLYRIASSKQDIAALRQEIEAGRSKDTPASAGAQTFGPAQQECEALAAAPYDLSRPDGVPGVQFEKIDAPRAEAACRRAVQEQPSPRLYALLGRALQAGRKYADAIANYRVAAEQGYAPGQHRLGSMYYNGEGIAKDFGQAVFWYRKAAEQGYAPGQDNLGALYANGEGVQKDIARAMALFRTAAEQGYANSELNLGRMYDETKDFAQAAVWYRKAAEHGDIEAANNLGSLYYNGLGVPENNQEAIFWFKKAAAAGNAMAQKNLDRVAEDQRRARAASAPSNSEYEYNREQNTRNLNDSADQERARQDAQDRQSDESRQRERNEMNQRSNDEIQRNLREYNLRR